MKRMTSGTVVVAACALLLGCGESEPSGAAPSGPSVQSESPSMQQAAQQAEQAAATTRDAFAAATNEQIAALETKIGELHTKAEAMAEDSAQALRAVIDKANETLDGVKADMDALKNATGEQIEALTNKISQSMKDIEAMVSEAANLG